jgi:hypothetical protein
MAKVFTHNDAANNGAKVFLKFYLYLVWFHDIFFETFQS